MENLALDEIFALWKLLGEKKKRMKMDVLKKST